MYLLPLFLILFATSIVQALNLNSTFDHFVFTQFWAPQSCRDLHNNCKFSHIPPIWTIHGLWPTDEHSKRYPSYCTKEKFNIRLLEGIRNVMSKYWFTYIKGGSDVEFWQHEWEKHGTCAVSEDNSVFHDQLSYFTTVLNLYTQYNVSAILQLADIYPGNAYRLDKFQEAFRGVFELEDVVGLRCTGHYVSGVEMCFDRELFPIQCQLSNCPNTELVYN